MCSIHCHVHYKLYQNVHSFSFKFSSFEIVLFLAYMVLKRHSGISFKICRVFCCLHTFKRMIDSHHLLLFSCVYRDAFHVPWTNSGSVFQKQIHQLTYLADYQIVKICQSKSWLKESARLLSHRPKAETAKGQNNPQCAVL